LKSKQLKAGMPIELYMDGFHLEVSLSCNSAAEILLAS